MTRFKFFDLPMQLGGITSLGMTLVSVVTSECGFTVGKLRDGSESNWVFADVVLVKSNKLTESAWCRSQQVVGANRTTIIALPYDTLIRTKIALVNLCEQRVFCIVC